MNRSEYLVDSGIPWIGKIPNNWSIQPLWSMYQRIKDTDHPNEQMLSIFREHGVVPKDSRQNLNKTADNRSIYQLVHPGWLVTNRMKAWQGSVGVSTHRGIVSGHYICFAPKHEADHDYLNWLFRSSPYIDGYRLISRGVRPGQAEIDNDHYRLLPVLLPPAAEQRRIADYLDRETARIDTLITEQNRLVDMLRGRRSALISHSVNKGQYLTFRRIVINLRQGWSPNCSPWPANGVQEWGILKVGCSNGGIFDATQSKRLPEEVEPRHEFVVRSGEIVMSRSNTRDLVGSAAVVPKEYPRMMLSDLNYGISLAPDMSPRFISYALNSSRARHDIIMSAKGSSPTMQKLSQRDILSLKIRVPNTEEQYRIVQYLDEQTSQIDTLITESEKLIELSRERRSALITAAVTGQIDIPQEV